MRFAQRELQKRELEAAHAAGFTEIRSAHMILIWLIRIRGARLTELAALAGMTKPSMGYLVDSLAEHGYCERVPDPADRRAQIVRLTEKGEAMSLACRSGVEGIEAEWIELVGPEAWESARRTLMTIVATLEPDEAEIKAIESVP